MELVTIAQGIAALGTTGILGLLFWLWLTGKIHSDTEFKQNVSDGEKGRADTNEALMYREALRLEAVADRKAADERVDRITRTLSETNELMRRSLDLNERLVEEATRRPIRRTRAS